MAHCMQLSGCSPSGIINTYKVSNDSDLDIEDRSILGLKGRCIEVRETWPDWGGG